VTPLYPFHFISFPTLFGEHIIHDTSRGREGDVQTLSVSIQAAPLIDPVQRETFRRFFIDLAAETKDQEATYGTAERQKHRPSVLGTPLITSARSWYWRNRSVNPLVQALPGCRRPSPSEPSSTKDLRRWPPSSPERLTTHMLVPITSA
jgi:hypothetical protein